MIHAPSEDESASSFTSVLHPRRWLRLAARVLSVGTRGERLAARYLRRDGYVILGRNLRTRLGEVDILAQAPDERTIVVVEVKTADRSGCSDDASANPPPPPEARVNRHKQHKLTAMACQLARHYRLTDRPIRFDVVAVEFWRGRSPAVRHHVGAFQSHV